MRTLTRLTILRRMSAARHRDRDLRARPASARPRSRSRSPSGCARTGEDPVAISADALQVYAGPRDPHRRGRARDERARLEHRLVGFLPVTETFSAGAYARARARRDRRALAAGRRPIVVGGTGLYLRAALADLDLRPPPAAGVRERWHAELAARGPRRAARAAGRARARGRRRASRRATGSGSCARSSCSTPGVEPAPAAGGDSQLWTTDTRHPTLLAGLSMDRDALTRAHRRAASTRWSPPARDRRGARAPPRRARRATARQALGFEELLARRRRGDEGAHAPLRQAPAHLDAQAARASQAIDVTGREPRGRRGASCTA